MTQQTSADTAGHAATGPTSGPEAALAGGSFSQTLSRGLRVLELLAAQREPMSAATLASKLQMHRSVVYRLVRTLEAHKLLATEPDGRYTLGLGVLTLARGVRLDLRAIAMPRLTALADEVGATAIFSVAEAGDMVCVASAEPENSFLHVRYREGLRHPMSAGASGIAVLSAQPAQPGERAEVAKARELGYAVSQEELETGTAAVSAPVVVPGRGTQGCVALLLPKDSFRDQSALGDRVIAAARELAEALR